MWRDDWSFPMTYYNRGYGSSRRYGRGGYGMGGVSGNSVLFEFDCGFKLDYMDKLLIYSFSFVFFYNSLSMVATAWMDTVMEVV